MASPYVIDYTGSFLFPVTPEALWSAIEDMEHFEGWWSWLSEFELDGDGLRSGSVLRGVVSPPVPYRMTVRVDLEHCDPPGRIDAVVHGDLEGPARLTLKAEGDGTRADVSWRIEMTERRMRVAARLAGPLLRWGHDRVVETTVRGFRRQLTRR
ncbi:MAG TPA: SRPBCC family protein [Acidimicrobiales bacterium]|nr:SRPBCC family protein [Acidimicrobiales bacterium]